MQLTLLVVQVSILYYGGHLVISGQMSSGNLIAFIIYEFVLGDCMEVRCSRGRAGAVRREQVPVSVGWVGLNQIECMEDGSKTHPRTPPGPTSKVYL